MESANNSDKYHIPCVDIIHDFDKHLSIPNNLRIFFSAKFGTGKSYFLEKFFEKKEPEYEVIKVYPIKYSTASNTDVFELIKFDILFHLIRHHEVEIKSNASLSAFMQFQWFIRGKLDKIDTDLTADLLFSLTDNEEIKKSLGFNPAIVKTFYSIYQKVSKNYKEFLAKEKNDDVDKVDTFLENIVEKMPEYGDADPLTCIIKDVISSIQKKAKKQIVLLIDDMDRLDPDHLFRILNIFGNHLESSSKNQFYINENRFGFDKIIFVGDIANIKNIFHHKYGPNTDFDGYFNKYYSKAIYDYVSYHIINTNIPIFMQGIKIPQSVETANKTNTTKNIIETIIEKLTEANSFTFRLIGQKRDYNFFLNTKLELLHKPLNPNSDVMVYEVYNFFLRFYRDNHSLILAINSIKDFDIYSPILTLPKYKEFFYGLLYYTEHIYIDGKKEVFKNKQKENVFRVKLKSLGDEYYHLHYTTTKGSLEILKMTYIDSEKEVHVPKISFKYMFINFIESYDF